MMTSLKNLCVIAVSACMTPETIKKDVMELYDVAKEDIIEEIKRNL